MIDVYHEATDTIVALRARVALLEDLVKSAPVPHPAPHECAWDCRDTCSARDAWRERRRLLLMARLDDAITHLATALAGSIPSDDQIIMGHVRDALALLREHRAAERGARRVLCSCRHWIDWHEAEYVGAMVDEVAKLELRNCPRCGSTRAVEVGGEQMGEVA